MIKRTSKIIAILISLVLAISICGVAATWQFADNSPNPETEDLTVDIANFKWTISSLIEEIVAEVNSDSSDINDNLEKRFKGNEYGLGKRNFYGSMDPQHSPTEGIAEMLEKFGSNMSFIFEAEVDRNYSNTDTYETAYIYTTDVYLGEGGESTEVTLFGATVGYNNTVAGNLTVPIGENIYRIYRTELSRYDTGNGVMSDWEIVKTELGYAPSCWYPENRWLSPLATQIPSYDISNWEAGTRGDSEETAVYTFDGDTPSAYNDLYDVNADLEKANYTNGDCFYYVLETTGNTYYYAYDVSNSAYTYYGTTRTNGSSSASYTYNATGTYTITCDLETASIRVYTVSGGTQTNLTLTQNTVAEGVSYSFSASSTETKYYIEVNSGGKTANFTINKTA